MGLPAAAALRDRCTRACTLAGQTELTPAANQDKTPEINKNLKGKDVSSLYRRARRPSPGMRIGGPEPFLALCSRNLDNLLKECVRALSSARRGQKRGSNHPTGTFSFVCARSCCAESKIFARRFKLSTTFMILAENSPAAVRRRLERTDSTWDRGPSHGATRLAKSRKSCPEVPETVWFTPACRKWTDHSRVVTNFGTHRGTT